MFLTAACFPSYWEISVAYPTVAIRIKFHDFSMAYESL